MSNEIQKKIDKIINSVPNLTKGQIYWVEQVIESFNSPHEFTVLNSKLVSEEILKVGYLCISKAIVSDKENVNLYKDRLLLLRIGHEPLKYTVMSALNLNARGPLSFSFQKAPLKARDAIYKMEISDLELNPILYQQIDFFRQRIDEFNEMIENEFFLPDRIKDEIVNKGIENHKKLFDYLENRVINEGDIDF